VLGRLSMPVDEALGLMTERLNEAAQETQALRAYIAS